MIVVGGLCVHYPLLVMDYLALWELLVVIVAGRSALSIVLTAVQSARTVCAIQQSSFITTWPSDVV